MDTWTHLIRSVTWRNHWKSFAHSNCTKFYQPSRIGNTVYYLFTLFVLAGCSANAEQDAAVEIRLEVAPTIYGGRVDEEGGDRNAVLALKVQQTRGAELCSGTLIAPNLVLTARHCVTRTLSKDVQCDEDGNSRWGVHLDTDLRGDEVSVYVGGNPNLSGPPAAIAKDIVTPSGKVVCNADIALVVLDKPVDAQPLPVRLFGTTPEGSALTTVGYGRNDQALPMGTRIRKTGVPLLEIGKKVSRSRTPLGSREFEAGLSICAGDSGGPALDAKTGAVVGVGSRGSGCGESTGHVFTSTSAFRDLIVAAAERANARITPEGYAEETVHEASQGEATPQAGGCSAGRTSGGSAWGFLLMIPLVWRGRRAHARG